jgi:hypothetical protein
MEVDKSEVPYFQYIRTALETLSLDWPEGQVRRAECYNSRGSWRELGESGRLAWE